ncbi:LysR family transcriptional regulator [Rhizobium sp. LEGMi198b]|uniref:LysR family transcriptional regulator n=1 Tax=Rhizobium sp. CB3060 TaxID=3138255 RepID=UPI0021A5B723|nr:LysR family transcriptional regulator [Rhizobium tropici]UWU25730.1 LysR family transcriptional regulator [Rhizobium tropici]
MRFKGLDLNLLVALDALTTERNVSAAACSINLSQPAMSAAVRRLRDYFGDDLFTMQNRKLILTPRAESLASAVRETLQHIQLNVISAGSFALDEPERHFTIALCDFMTTVFFRKIIKRLAREAPAVSFELIPLPDNPDQLLRRGKADFLILPELFMSSAHPRAKLFDEKFVSVGCTTNTKLSRHLTVRDYMSMGHVTAKSGVGQQQSLEDFYLSERGVKRRIEVAVQSFGMVPAALLGTDRLAIMPLRLVKHLAPSMPLRIVESPIPLPAFTEGIQWPASHENDPASTWMREIILQEAYRIASPSMCREGDT